MSVFNKFFNRRFNWRFNGGFNRGEKESRALDVILDFSATDKWHAIEKMVRHLAALHNITEVNQLLDEVCVREKQISTGMEFGIAMPHVKTSLVDKTRTMVVIAKDGIEFDSFDQKPSTIIVMILSPLDKLEEHVQTMARLSSILSKESNRELILSAGNVEDVHKVFASNE